MKMKNTILLSLLTFLFLGARAQNGLENVSVEVYYISDANDANADADGGVLPVGSVTYRIYADLLQGYNFQAGYGVPTHELRIETSTLFFNNEMYGNTFPSFSKNNSAKNTVMLDSWLSTGGACTGWFGTLKSLDNGVSNTVNNYSPQVLQNNDANAGIPLTTQDGMIQVSGRTPGTTAEIGMDQEILVFADQNDGTNGPVFSTFNGSWYVFGGAQGPDTVDNKVLIAQITTDGVFSFSLNIQVGTPGGSTENYVATNPQAGEILEPTLTYSSNVGVHAVADKNEAMMLMTYPNPVSDNLRIKMIAPKGGKSNSYTIYDLMGRSLFHKELSSSTNMYLENVDMSSLASGVYVVEMNADGVRTSKRVVKN